MTHADTKTTKKLPLKKEPTLSSAPHSSSKKCRFSSWLAFLIIFIVLLSFVSVTLFKQQQHQAQQFSSQMHAWQQQQRDILAQIEARIQTFEAAESKWQDQINASNKYVQSTLQQRLYQTKDWLLLKARYYLELAQINATWSDNFQTTLALLKEADYLLENTQNQQTLAIRQTITKEIATLQALPKPDTTGLLIQLDAAQNRIPQLPLKPALVPIENKEIITTPSSSASDWQKNFKATIHLLEKLVIVRRQTEDILPLPSPIYEAMLREQIQFNLQKAEWAILKNIDSVYQLSLIETINNIKRSFDPSAADTQDVLKQLQKLQQVHLISQRTLQLTSLPLLNQLIESKDAQLSSPGEGEHP